MPFRRIICGKSKHTADYTAKRHAFPQDKPWIILRKVLCTAESRSLTFKRPINLLLKLISYKNLTRNDH
jgi:hypothetical protein